MTTATELPTLSLNMLNQVWDGIRTGKLEHNQQHIFCGTAACVAGWTLAFHAQEIDLKRYIQMGDEGVNIRDRVFSIVSDDKNFSAWDKAQELLGLTDLEANLLFHRDADKLTQVLLIEDLNEGYRYDTEDDLSSARDEFYEDLESAYIPTARTYVGF